MLSKEHELRVLTDADDTASKGKKIDKRIHSASKESPPFVIAAHLS
jgi:hypothetical protein